MAGITFLCSPKTFLSLLVLPDRGHTFPPVENRPIFSNTAAKIRFLELFSWLRFQKSTMGI